MPDFEYHKYAIHLMVYSNFMSVEGNRGKDVDTMKKTNGMINDF